MKINFIKTIYLVFILIFFIACSSHKKKDQSILNSEKISVSDFPKQEKVSESYKRGKEVYSDFCLTCHLPNGKGIPGNSPPLAGSDWLTNKKYESIKAIKYGLSGPILVNGESYENVMGAQGLSDQEVVDIMNYISNSWGNSSKKEVTLEEVQSISK
ncbi:cytochrome c [Gillisia sp. Hel_I_86]|uniref:c-type cytochrome n=1 Tax=Gillisia sp. Hel_I_86 TaxID=1249981 RepID=UPI00119AD129|nr:cytochrome c [Gillisia sp. Hel_I_86]TVZ25139.1 cytochrome c [Gillisia sp. Hel_I_86]